MREKFIKRVWAEYEEGRVAVNDKGLVKDTWGEWLSESWDWEWYATLTFRENVGTRRADYLWRTWYKQLITETSKDVQYVRCEELQLSRGVPHYHALLLNLKHVRRLKWLDRWVELAGWAQIYMYNPHKGAAYYLSKYVTKELGKIQFSPELEQYTVDSGRPVQLEFS